MNAGIAMQPKQFEIQNPQKFDDVSPSFETPTEIGYFSLDINRDFEISKKSLRYFIKPKTPERVKFDLRKGYDTMIRTDREMEPNMLDWIVKNMEKFPNLQDSNRPPEGASGYDRSKIRHRKSESSPSTTRQDPVNVDRRLATGFSKIGISPKDTSQSPITTGKVNRRLDTDFVCRRGCLAKIMCTPYEQNEDWLIAVMRHKGTYYLHEFETEEKKQKEATMDDRYKEMCGWGWKFEQYLTSDSKDGKPNSDVPYNNCEAFFTVVRTKLGDHSLVFNGEVDALNAEKENCCYYTEFKTHKQLDDERQIKNFKRFKLKKWWAQSYITGVKEIVCGFRDDDGVVHNLKFYKTDDLPGLAEDIYNPWKPNVCLNALDQFLSFIKSSITTDNPGIVHTMKWSPGQPVLCSEPLRDSKYNFIPAWFTDVVK